MKLSEFDYKYPDELIATHPLPDRDASRMMVLNRVGEEIRHSHIKDIPNFLKKGDLLVINNTRVFPARLVGKKESGGYFEILLLKECEIPPHPPLQKGGRGGFWRCITNQTKTSKPGLKILFGDQLVGTIISREGEELIIEFNKPELIEDVGLPPVPPYIRARRSVAQDFSPANTSRSKDLRYTSDDNARYQTIYARHTGSAAAPTAGLHFTEKLLKRIKDAGVDVASVTLHVGLDTFSPVREENILKHKIHGEEYSVPDETIAAIERIKSTGGRVIAVGTTSVRALESLYSPLLCKEGLGEVDEISTPSGSPLQRGRKGVTNLFIYPSATKTLADGLKSSASGITTLFISPGYKFRIVDAILTNFHQPRSTLLMLVSAFAGREFILRAYEEAIEKRYRLFSYGDCMLIL